MTVRGMYKARNVSTCVSVSEATRSTRDVSMDLTLPLSNAYSTALNGQRDIHMLNISQTTRTKIRHLLDVKSFQYIVFPEKLVCSTVGNSSAVVFGVGWDEHHPKKARAAAKHQFTRVAGSTISSAHHGTIVFIRTLPLQIQTSPKS